MNRSKPLILDVRDAAEFAAGHIQGARHIPVAELAGRIKEIEKFKDKPVLVHCQKGMRAKAACSILREQQFSQLHNLQGGLDSWIEAKIAASEKLKIKWLKILMYSTAVCPYCINAERLLLAKV